MFLAGLYIPIYLINSIFISFYGVNEGLDILYHIHRLTILYPIVIFWVHKLFSLLYNNGRKNTSVFDNVTIKGFIYCVVISTLFSYFDLSG